MIDLFNPLKVVSALKRSNRLYHLVLMLSPFLEPMIDGHFSVVLGAIGIGAFFMVAHTVVSMDADAQKDV